MAGAPHKQGLEFVSLDVNFFDDPRFTLLEEQNPAICFKYYMIINAYIVRSTHYISWNDKSVSEFCKLQGLNKKELNAALAVLLKVDLFNKELFDKYSIVTSHELQSQYLRDTFRRRQQIFIQEYLLIDLEITKRNKQVLLQNINGDIIRDFGNEKKIIAAKMKEDKPVKHIPPPASGTTYVTASDLEDFIKMPYELRPNLYKDNNDRNWYESYVVLSKEILSFRGLRGCLYQLTLPEYKKMFTEIKPQINKEEMKEAIVLLDKRGIKPEQQMIHRLGDAIDWVRKNKINDNKGTGFNGKTLQPKIILPGTNLLNPPSSGK